MEDPIKLAEGLLGRPLTDEERAQILSAMAGMGADPEPQAQPVNDWTNGFADQLHPLGMSGKRIGGAGAIAASHFLGGVPGVGPELAGGAFAGGLSALADQPAGAIARSTALGAGIGGPTSRILGPLIEGAAPAVSRFFGDALRTNDAAVSNALAGDASMAHPELFTRPRVDAQAGAAQEAAAMREQMDAARRSWLDPQHVGTANERPLDLPAPAWGGGEPVPTALNTGLEQANIPVEQLRGMSQSQLYQAMGLDSTLNEAPPLASQTPMGVPSEASRLPYRSGWGDIGGGEVNYEQPLSGSGPPPWQQASAITRDQRMNELSRLNQIPRSFAEELADSLMERMGRAHASRAVRPPAELRLPPSTTEGSEDVAPAPEVRTRPQRPRAGERKSR